MASANPGSMSEIRLIQSSCITAIDVGVTGGAEELSATLSEGVTYYIIVDGYSSSAGDDGEYTIGVSAL